MMNQLSLDILRDLAIEEGVSEAELQVLHLALNGKSPSQIKAILGIQSENAVQKKLARVYTRFRIAGAGPGKLPKLQKILIDRLQTKQARRKVLIVWVGEQGKVLAEGLKDIFKHPQVEAITLEAAAFPNANWQGEPAQILAGVDYGIFCLASEASEQPLISFTIGLLCGKLQNFWLVHCGIKATIANLSLPFPAIDATDSAALATLLHQIIDGSFEEAKDWVAFKTTTAAWTKKIVPENGTEPENVSEDLIVEAGQALLKRNSYFHQNLVFQKLMMGVLSDINQHMTKVGKDGAVFSIPLELYPRYLAFLQRELQVRVKAVAVVGSVEHFWSNQEGDEIAETARGDSERVFVFSSENDFNIGLNFLLRQAYYYKVFVTTKEVYLPYAEEHSLKERSQQWKEDFSLPTQEFSIIEDPKTGHQLLAWYDEDNIAELRSKRLVHFSPIAGEIEQYKQVLSNFIERANRNQGVSQVRSVGDRAVPRRIEMIREELFRKPPQVLSPEALLKDLQQLRNQLMHLKTKEEVIQEALKIVQDKLNSQTAAIFLFAKDGRLHREGMNGTDQDGRAIENSTFFPEESYAPGESFTGKVLSIGENFGKPQWFTNLDDTSLLPLNRENYQKHLGSLNSAIAVPLNGQNKTYGVLEVINKFDPITQKVIPGRGFSQDEVYWLAAISSAVSLAISNIRKNRQNKLYADLSHYLLSYGFDLSAVYDEVTRRLTSDETAFKACILRVKNKAGELEEVSRAPKSDKEVKWESRKEEPRSLGDGPVGDLMQDADVRENPQPRIIERISNQISIFRNRAWIEENQFKSFGCFPLVYKGNLVGAISLYTAYEYNFHPGSMDFLNRVSSLVAAFIGREKQTECWEDAIRGLNPKDAARFQACQEPNRANGNRFDTRFSTFSQTVCSSEPLD